MLKIATYQDIKNINTLDKDYIESIEQYFKELVTSITGNQTLWRTYNLIHDGPILLSYTMESGLTANNFLPNWQLNFTLKS